MFNLKLVGLASRGLPWADSCGALRHPFLPVALGCADDGFNLVVPRRVELLFRE